MDRKVVWVVASLFLLISQASNSATISVSLPINATSSEIVAGGNIPEGILSTDTPIAGFIQLPIEHELGADTESISIIDNHLGIELTISEGTYDTANGLPISISEITTENSRISLEPNTVSQDRVGVNTWGIDSESPISTSSNAALIFDFRESDADVTQFAAALIDVEGGNGRNSFVGLYNELGNRFYQSPLLLPGDSNNFGNKEVRYMGIETVGDETLSIIVLSVGDDDDSDGTKERMAVGDFYAGTTAKAPIPTPVPAGIWLMLSALLSSALLRGKLASK